MSDSIDSQQPDEPFWDIVFDAELKEIEKRRQTLAPESPTFESRKPSASLGLVGLAISGGGIRSSTFALGVIQALAANGVFKAVDYMSTVSGGGFIGSCLSSMLNDERQVPPVPFPLATQTGHGEPPALIHLRNKSKYLAPGGALDKLRIPALLLRGTLNNFAIFLFIVMLTVIATQVFYQFAWKYGFEFGYYLAPGFFLFVLLPLLYSAYLFLRRLVRNSTWENRNRAETWFGWWLAFFIAILILIPLDAFLNRAVEATWPELRTLLLDSMQRPIETGDTYKFLGGAAALLAFLLATRVSQRVSAISGKLLLLGLGILGPAMLFLIYLGLVVIEIDSPIVRPKTLFTVKGVDVDFMPVKDDLEKLKAQFAARWIPLTNVAHLHTEDHGGRWVIHDGDSAYGITRLSNGDELAVAQDFEFVLDRCRVSPELRDALVAKGYTISKHPRVTSGSVPDLAKFRNATKMLPAEFTCGGSEPAAAASQLSEPAGPVPHWLAIAGKAPAPEDQYLWGNHTLAVVKDRDVVKLVQVVHPSLALEALQIASSPLERYTRQPLETLILDSVSGNDDELETARRFIKDTTKQQDLLVVIDHAAAAVFDPRAVVVDEVQKLRESGAYPEGRKTVRMAFLEVDKSAIARYTDFRSPDFAGTGKPGNLDVCKADLARNISTNADLRGGPAVLSCAARLLEQDGREGAEKSILFFGSVAAQPGQQLSEIEGLSTIPWSRFQWFVLDLARVPAKSSGPAVTANKALPGPLSAMAGATHVHYRAIEESGKANAHWREMVGQTIARVASNSPQREFFPLQKNKYKLYREGSFVRVEVKVDGAALRDLASDDEVFSFFSGATQLKLTPGARAVPASAAEEDRPASRDICADPSGEGRASRCWRIEAPYLFKINNVSGGLRVLDQRTDPPWWIPASIVTVATEPGREWSWEDYTLRRPWVLVLLFLLVFWWIYDVNSTTLHRFYRDRLSKAFLIRLAPRGKNGEFEVMPNDGLKLSELNRAGTAPYHLINVALNLEDSKAEDLRGRGADFFVFSKLFVGSPRAGFVRTEQMEKYDRQLDLATAMAISGGAAAPSMGTTTVKPLVFIMTLLNIRLNYWLPNPRYVAKRNAVRHLRFMPGPFYLLREALGSLNERKPYVNVSDGGHIENLGIYELLRRRCKTIIAIDGEADPEMRFNGLMTLVRYARIDLGIRVEFDLKGGLDNIRKLAAASFSKQNWAAARISYGDGEYGWLYYIKSSITGAEEDYVKDYWARNPDFPHQSTADQFFDETQFEAYRALGEEIGGRFCAAVVANAKGRDEFSRLHSTPAAQSGVTIARLWATTLADGFTPDRPGTSGNSFQA